MIFANRASAGATRVAHARGIANSFGCLANIFQSGAQGILQMRQLLLGACFLFFAAYTSVCRADLVMQFGQGGVIGITELTTQTGSSIVLDVYLTQRGLFDTGIGFDAGDYRLSSGSSTRGLGSFLFDLQITNASLGDAQTDVLPTDPAVSFVYGPDLSDATGENSVAGSTARYAGFAPFIDATTLSPVYVAEPFNAQPNIPNTNSVADNSILLGTLSVDVSANATGSYELALISPEPSALYGFGIGAAALGPFIAVQGNSLTVTAVPEPGCAGIMLLATIGLASHRRRLQ